jgi:hypothetical protein
MPPEIRQRFERLLLEHSLWTRTKDRAVLLRDLRDHEVWDHLELDGSPTQAAHNLLTLYGKYGPEPFRIALRAMQAAGNADPDRRREVEALDEWLRSQQARRHRGPWSEAPYRGLHYFDRRHAPIFFGRDQEVDRLLQTVADPARRFTVVVGASGAGKSSLVRAGLWARLCEGNIDELPGSQNWLITAMIPTEMDTPAGSLRAALLRSLQERDDFEDQRACAADLDRRPLTELAQHLLGPGDSRWLLILDQMEELFAADPARKQAGAEFLDRLIKAAAPGSRFQVLATLRADFFHHCLDHPPLKRAVEREGGTFLLGPPGRLPLERMVSGPLTEVDLPQRWTLDPELPPTLALDADRHPGGLALMAFALRELYDRCKPSRRMDVTSYRAMGGLGGAIARRADATLARLGPGAEEALGRVFSRLVRVDRDDAATRQREHLSAWKDDEEALRLVGAFTQARLLVQDREVEVAHEALLREWPKLSEWIAQRREAFRLADRVQTEAKAWREEDPKQRWRRPWADHVIEEHRRSFEKSGLLTGLIREPKVARLLTPEVDWILAELQDDATTHSRRRDIGQRLAEIGDPRPGVGLRDGLPDILWRPIPAGERVKPFHMAAFSVTVCQFRAFLEAKDGYPAKRWWKDLQHEDPDGAWQTRMDNHPITDVSWYDATAFCRWLSARLGYEVRLPDEEERQWAAQSARAEFQYPWGPEWRDRVANTHESKNGGAIAVGMYPGGESLQRVSDLAGNVWEWCRNSSGEKEERSLRGGSWGSFQVDARASFRNLYHPFFRAIDFGFRVVCFSPIAGR